MGNRCSPNQDTHQDTASMPYQQGSRNDESGSMRPAVRLGSYQYGDDVDTDIEKAPNKVRPPPSSPTRPPLAPLGQTTTHLSTSSAVEAAQILANFATHPAHPRNWSNRQKWKVTATVAVTGFIATCGSSIGVPGVHAVVDDFGVGNAKIGTLITTFYVLGLGAGPFLFSPISELYGRQVAYLTSQICFLFFCIGTAVAQNMSSLLVLRFLCGVFASSGPALGVATCADVWAPEERGRPVSLYAIGPMAGPVLGSMIGYWILYGGWRWLFYAITIMAAMNTLLFIFSATETNAQVIEKKLKYRIHHPIKSATGFRDRISPSRWIHELGWMSAMVSRHDAREVFGKTFSRPVRLLFLNPVCAIFSMYYAYIYACIYLFLVSIPLLFGSPPFSRPGLFTYSWPISTVSLAYIGLACGFATAATIASNMQDRIYRHLKKNNGGEGQPEYRLVMTQAGMIIMPIGLLIFGWTANAEVHWIGPQIGQMIVGLGLMLAFNSIQNFLVDAFFPYSAAAIAAATACRSILTSILPVFAPDMFADLGWGKGGTLLAGIALVAVPAPLIVDVALWAAIARKIRIRRMTLERWVL